MGGRGCRGVPAHTLYHHPLLWPRWALDLPRPPGSPGRDGPCRVQQLLVRTPGSPRAVPAPTFLPGSRNPREEAGFQPGWGVGGPSGRGGALRRAEGRGRGWNKGRAHKAHGPGPAGNKSRPRPRSPATPPPPRAGARGASPQEGASPGGGRVRAGPAGPAAPHPPRAAPSHQLLPRLSPRPGPWPAGRVGSPARNGIADRACAASWEPAGRAGSRVFDVKQQKD